MKSTSGALLLHAPAAFLVSSSLSQALVGNMLGHTPGPSPHKSSTATALASVASQLEWQCLEDIDVPLHQHPLLLAINKTLH